MPQVSSGMVKGSVAGVAAATKCHYVYRLCLRLTVLPANSDYGFGLAVKCTEESARSAETCHVGPSAKDVDGVQ